jgi:hypothetical protein
MSTNEDDRRQHAGNAPPASAERRRRRNRGSGSIRKRHGIFFIRYTAWDPKQKKRRRIEERTSVRSVTEARDLLNERLGSVAKGETPAAVSRTRLCQLYDDVHADYRNRNQRVDVLEGDGDTLNPSSATT